MPGIHEVPPNFMAFTHSLQEFCGSLRLQKAGPNLSPDLRSAITEFRSSGLIACPADKGSTVVVIPASRYESLCLAHLDGPAYARVTNIPLVNQLLRIATEPIWHSLPPPPPRVHPPSVLHHLPPLPGRPVCHPPAAGRPGGRNRAPDLWLSGVLHHRRGSRMLLIPHKHY